MKDGAVIRCVSIFGGVTLLVACLLTGLDGETKVIAGAMIGFGIGVPVGAIAEKIDIAQQVDELKAIAKAQKKRK